jgi:hypothetical protein
MSDELGQILRRFEEAVSAAAADAVEDMRAFCARMSNTPKTPSDDAGALPPDLIKQCQAVAAFKVSRSFLYDLGIEQVRLGGRVAIRLENGDFRYSQSGLERYLKENPVRRRKR